MLSNKVWEIMNREVTTTAASTPILTAMEKMAAENVGRVVITEDRMPMGIFTDHDILRRVLHRKLNIEKASIRKVMTTPIRGMREDGHILDALRQMYRGKFRHMLVRGEEGQMVGLISIRRIFKLAVELGQGKYKTRTVGSIMSGKPDGVKPSTSIFDTVKGMKEKDICGVLVVDKGEPKGIFTSRDILNRVVVKNINKKMTPVEEVMTANPIVVSHSAPVSEALSKMYDGNFRHMPVRCAKNKIVGMLTMSDVLKYAKVLNVDGSVRRTWKEIKEFWESEDHYTPG